MLHGIGLGDLQKLNNDPELQEKMTKVHRSVEKLVDFVNVTWRDWLNKMDKIDEIRKGTGAILNFHPDLSSLMSIRLETFKALLADNQNKSDDNKVKQCIQDELQFTKSLVRTQSKSYGAWNYRLFIYRWCYGMTVGRDVPDKTCQSVIDFSREYDGEKSFCLEILMKDGRNFHVWNYIREICYLQSTVEEETEEESRSWMARSLIEFAKFELLNENLSNYSAWNCVMKTCSDGGLASEEYTELWDELEPLLMSLLMVDPVNQTGWTALISRLNCVRTSCNESSFQSYIDGLAVQLKELSDAWRDELPSSINDKCKVSYFRFLWLTRKYYRGENWRILGFDLEGLRELCITTDPLRKCLYIEI